MTDSGSTLEYLYSRRWPLAAAAVAFLILAAVAYFFRPVLDGLIFGIFFAYVTRPVKEFLGRYTRYAPHLATFCIVLPAILLFLFAALELRKQVSWLANHGGETPGLVHDTLATLGVPGEILAQVDEVLLNLAHYAFAFASALPMRETFSALLLFGTNALVSIFVCYYLLKDGDKVLTTLKSLTPARFRPVLDDFTVEADRILSGIYIGTFYTALFIALASAVLFFLFGVPYLVLCTAFVFIAAMVPILSGMMVFLPLTAYLYIYRDPGTAALFLLAAIALVYLPPDFLIRPYLINKTSSLHPLLIILSFIGGGLAGGLSGFFAAPLAVGLLVAGYHTYQKYGRDSEG